MMIAKRIRYTLIGALTGLTLAASAAWGQVLAHPEDAAFAAALDAFTKGDRARLERAAAGLREHPLAAWGEYFLLARDIDARGSEEVAAFLARHEDTYLAEKLRSEWVRASIRRGAWHEAHDQFRRLRLPDAEARCFGLDAALNLAERDALATARMRLDDEAPLPNGCIAPLGRLAAQGEFSADMLWQRLRRQLAAGRLKEARTLASWLPAGEVPAWKAVEAIAEHPVRHLAKLPGGFAATRPGRELAMFAALRMARADVRIAAARWQDIEAHFGASERGFVRGQLALRAALSHLPEAAAWFDDALALGVALTEEQHAWRVRSALRAEDWHAVARAIDTLPAAQATLPEWRYWRARAHRAAGDLPAAVHLWQGIADRPDFYGILAAEALGYRFAVPPAAAPVSAAELAEAGGRAGLVRGLALINAGLRLDGIREWSWALRSANDRQLLAAAELARRHESVDRAINAAERTRSEHDFGQRYPTPFLAQVEPRVRDVDLDPAWVYGLMRQESRFIMDARSSAGAQGLMQLMPATARWVARKIGMTDYRPARVNEMDTNVTLGTNYLRMVMDSLDSHPVLASAAYNAGPGRARKWRAERPIEGAIYAETIPFTETRDYVKKVMANATVYAALRADAAPSLTERLGTVRPRGFTDGTAEDLP